MKTTGVSSIPKFGLLGFLGHPSGHNQLLFWDQCITLYPGYVIAAQLFYLSWPPPWIGFWPSTWSTGSWTSSPWEWFIALPDFLNARCKMDHFRKFSFNDKFVRNTWQILARAPLVRGVWDIFLLWLCFLWNPIDCTIVPSSCTRHRRSCCQEWEKGPETRNMF